MSEAETEVANDAKFEFDAGFQSKIASLFLRDTSFALKTNDLIQPEYFTEDATGALIRIAKDHLRVYKSVPDLKILPTLIKDEIAAKRLRPDMLEGVKAVIKEAIKADLSNPDYVVDQVVRFAKHQAIEQAMMRSIPLLEKGQFDKIAEIMKKATSVGLTVDDGDYDYWAEIENRTKERADLLAGKIVREGITTGYPDIDGNLYHYGWGRRELSCIMGAAKAGKSMSLGDFGRNASLAGYNVLYITLEVSKKIIAERLDAANSDTLMRELHKDHARVEAAIKALRAKNAGHLRIREYASGTCKPSQVNRLIEDYRANGIIFDLVIVDYADIMAAEYRSDSMIENLRTIYIDLRAIAFEHNIAVLTATQTNREGAKASTAKATDIGDDWNKARTVDILIGINATDAEKAAGEARLTWLLSRNTEDGFSLRIKQDRQKMKFLTKVLGRV